MLRFFQRASVALSIAGIIAGVLRIKGRGGIPPREGGWRELPLSRSGD